MPRLPSASLIRAGAVALSLVVLSATVIAQRSDAKELARVRAKIEKLEDELRALRDRESALVVAARRDASKRRLLWRVSTRSDSKGSGAVADIDGDGALEIVFGTYFNDRHLYALDAKTGKIEWRFESDRGPLDASVAIADVDGDGRMDVLAADSSTGNLFCVDGRGREQWRLKLPNSTDSPPAIADLDGDGTNEIVVGSMWLGDRKGRVGVYRAKDRALVWEQKVPGCVQSAPCLIDLDGDQVLDVVVTSWRGDRGVHAFSGKDGEPLWRFETADGDKAFGMYHGPAVAVIGNERVLVVSTCAGDVYALGRDGAERWHRRIEGEYLFAPVTVADIDGDGREEAIVCGGRAVVAFDAATGKRQWRAAVPTSVSRGAVIADADGDGDADVVFCVGNELRVLDGKTGRQVLRHRVDPVGGQRGGRIASAPILADFDGDGSLDVFFVCGRGFYGKGGAMKKDNFGHAIALTLGGKGPGWATFRGNHHRTGRRE